MNDEIYVKVVGETTLFNDLQKEELLALKDALSDEEKQEIIDMAKGFDERSRQRYEKARTKLSEHFAKYRSKVSAMQDLDSRKKEELIANSEKLEQSLLKNILTQKKVEV